MEWLKELMIFLIAVINRGLNTLGLVFRFLTKGGTGQATEVQSLYRLHH